MAHSEQDQYLFVYGSLQRKANHPAHNILREYGQFICDAEFAGILFMVKEYPGVVRTNNPKESVKGELFMLKKPCKVFQKLDHYEGYDPNNPEQSLYVREKCSVHCISNAHNVIEAWIYLYNRPTDQLQSIPSGDYLSYIGYD